MENLLKITLIEKMAQELSNKFKLSNVCLTIISIEDSKFELYVEEFDICNSLELDHIENEYNCLVVFHNKSLDNKYLNKAFCFNDLKTFPESSLNIFLIGLQKLLFEINKQNTFGFGVCKFNQFEITEKRNNLKFTLNID